MELTISEEAVSHLRNKGGAMALDFIPVVG